MSSPPALQAQTTLFQPFKWLSSMFTCRLPVTLPIERTSPAVQLRPRADTRAVPWQGEPNCMASRRLHLAPSEALVSRGSQRAAGRPAREARAQLRDGR
jgi:hypothetical protein